MPIKSYGVLKGKAIESKNGMGSSPHFQILISDGDLLHRIAVNVKSQVEPSVLLYFVDEDFEHYCIDGLSALPEGFTPLESKPDTLALDFIRGNLFDTDRMKPLAHEIPGPDNDLNELIHRYVSKAIAMENAVIYAFGSKWGPEPKRDGYFGFKPGNGIHDIHMNQGNDTKWQKDDGVWQDGALLIHLPDENRWVGIFLAFQSQGFHTDDRNGHKLAGKRPEPAPLPTPEPVPAPTPGRGKRIRIIAAMVNAVGDERGRESVTLFNASPAPIDLQGWTLTDQRKRKEELEGVIPAGEAKKVRLSGQAAQLSNRGGIITLLDADGIKVDGVSYTGKEASREGWSLLF